MAVPFTKGVQSWRFSAEVKNWTEAQPHDTQSLHLAGAERPLVQGWKQRINAQVEGSLSRAQLVEFSRISPQAQKLDSPYVTSSLKYLKTSGSDPIRFRR